MISDGQMEHRVGVDVLTRVGEAVGLGPGEAVNTTIASGLPMGAISSRQQ